MTKPLRKASPLYQRQTILKLYNSGIPIEKISLQLDPSQSWMEKIIRELLSGDEKKIRGLRRFQKDPLLGSFYLDAVFDLKGHEEIIRIPHLDILGYTISKSHQNDISIPARSNNYRGAPV